MRNRIRLITRYSREAGMRLFVVPFANMRSRYKSWMDKGLKDFYKMIEHHKK